MPIAPIQQYQDPSNSLMQILQGGNQQIGSILDRAIQIGRDIVNKRTQQEQDLAAMRNQETAMAQRRGENLQSVLENQQKFGMEQDKFDFLKMDTQRKYDAQREDQAAQLGHQAWSEQFSQSQADRSAGFTERRLTLEEQAAQQRQAALDAEKQRMEALATPPSQPVATTGPTNPASTTPFEVAGPVNVLSIGRPGTGVSNKTVIGRGLNSMTTTGAPPMEKLLAVPSNVAGAAAKPYATLEREYQEAIAGKKAAVLRYGNERANALWDTILSEKEKALSAASGGQKPLTVSEQIRLRELQMKEQDRLSGKPQSSSLAPVRAQADTAGTALKQTVEGMPEAFQNPYSDMFAPKGETDLAKKSRTARAEQWSKNQAEGERQAALSLGRETYANKFYKDGMAADEVKRMVDARRKVWDLAQAEKSAQGTLMGGVPAATTSPVDFLNSQH